MILPESFSQKWILSFRKQKQYSKLDPILLEKMILALSLTEFLKNEGLVFIFKGGTSLTLHFDKPQRFSIDVDIITESTKEEIENTVKTICSNSVFSRYEYDSVRSFSNNIPKAHFKLFYISQINSKENYVLLDILFENSPYKNVLSLPLKNVFLKTDDNQTLIQIPSIDSITGDKLTAFAPNTIGIPFFIHKETETITKETEIIKQLFDLGRLYDFVTNFDEIIYAFENLTIKESAYRNKSFTVTNVLDDIVSTALLISKRQNQPSNSELEKFSLILSGINKFGNFLSTGSFHLDEAVEAAGKVALLALKIKGKDFSSLPVYNEKMSLNEFLISTTEYNYMNKFRSLPNKSLFYWYHVVNYLTSV